MAHETLQDSVEFRMAFRSANVTANNVDREALEIKNVVLAQVGEARTHNVHVEKKALQKFLDSSNSKFSEGLPLNYGHNWDNLGKSLGRFSRLQLKGNKLVGDIKFFKAADTSPTHPGMASYVMGMAEEDPKSIMLSLQFLHGEHYQYDKAGTRLRVKYYDSEWNWIPAYKEFGKVYIDIKEAVSCDVVHEGALTNGMFSSNSINQSMSYLASLPEFPEWVQNSIHTIPEINDYFATKYDTGFFSKLAKKFFSMDKPKPEAQAPPAVPATTEPTTPAAADPGVDQFQELKDQMTSMSDLITTQQAQIESLSKQPATETTTGTTEAAAAAGDEAIYLNDPINQRAMANFSRSKSSK